MILDFRKVAPYIKEISASGIKLYVYLSLMADENNICEATQEKIEESTGLTNTTIARIAKQLEEYQIIEMQRRYNKPTQYRLLVS